MIQSTKTGACYKWRLSYDTSKTCLWDVTTWSCMNALPNEIENKAHATAHCDHIKLVFTHYVGAYGHYVVAYGTM